MALTEIGEAIAMALRRIKNLRTWIKRWFRREMDSSVVVNFKTKFGIPARFHSPARAVLENVIIPYYASQGIASRVLFVGCEWYTKHYRKAFKRCEYWTIDLDPQKKTYGARRHIVDSLENLGRYCDQGYLDVIICNGVLGFGLNQKEAAERAFSQCSKCLRPGGVLILGWDDETPPLIPFRIEELQSLRQFVPHYFEPFSGSTYSLKPDYDYRFGFFEKAKEKKDPL